MNKILPTVAKPKVMIRIVFLITSLLFVLQQSRAQTISSFGSPYIQNFSKAQYKAGNQNWSIAQGPDGFIYTANNEGLLVYDGFYWELYPLSNKKHLRSVAIAPNGHIYVGGKEEFGYFERRHGKLVYHRLSDLVNPALLENDDIWKIILTEDKVIFQAFSKLYILRDNKIEIQYGQGEPFLFAHQIDNKIWIEKIPSGLQRWTADSFQPLANKITNILTVLSFGKEEYLLGTAKEGLFILDLQGNLRKWTPNPQLESLLKEGQINNGLKVSENIYAFGTIKNGIIIINAEGQILQHIHKRNGLQNNTVLSMTLDKQGNIWAGLDNGIDRIEINAPFYYYKDIFGELGTVYAIKIFDNHIYLGTNQGLFYAPWPSNRNINHLNLQFVSGSQGQVWTLDVFNNQLICGHNDGTFLVEGHRLKRISEWTGGWINQQHSALHFVQGNYTGLASFTQKNNSWTLNQKLPFPKEAVVNLIQKEKNQYWTVLNKAILLVQFGGSFKDVQILKTFRFDKDFPQISRLHPQTIEGNTLFFSDKGIFIYDNVLSKFSLYSDLNKSLGRFSKANRIKGIEKGKYIFALEGDFALVHIGKDMIQVDSTSFNILKNAVMKNYEIVEPYQQKLLFGLDNGIAIYDPHSYNKSLITPPFVKGYRQLNTSSDSLYHLTEESKIPFKRNSIRILFASPWFSSTPLKYQYLLEGSNTEWDTPTETPYVDFTNLEWGKYTFKVRAISDSGETSDWTVVSFRILPPWYLTWQALVIYFLLACIAFFVARKMVIQKIARDKQRIRQELQQRQEELLRKEAEENEKKLMALKNEQLSQELELKNRQLANAATNIIYKNELLDNLHVELLKIKDKDGKPLSNEQLQKINKLINNAKSDDRDWDLFEKSFNESHENFFKKLKAQYPSLSPNDLKLCAYLRLNMSSKDIASLINISIRGVEIRRYRLRKKFNLPTHKNLNEFLMEL